MPDYRLQLQIDPADLAIIRGSGQRITLAKPVSADSSPNVVWLSIDPFESTDVEWSEEYGIYASTVAVVQGATISKLSETGIGAQDGANYSFTSAAVFNGPFPGGGVPAGSYGARNDMPSSNYPLLTFGLTQSALINTVPQSRKPISATPVLATQQAVMTPFSSVYIWLQSQFTSETIITTITGRSAKAVFGDGVTDIGLKYDATIGAFLPSTVQGRAVANDHTSVQLSLPKTF